MTSLIDKIELLIKREKASPEQKKKDDSTKSSSEILSELFSVFNADPPKIEEVTVKKSKKSKKKHKKEKKKRSRSSSSSNSDASEYSRKRKKRKKSKSKKRHVSSDEDSSSCSSTPKVKPEPTKVKYERVKLENSKSDTNKTKYKVKPEPKEEKRRVSVKTADNKIKIAVDSFDTSKIPLPDDPGLEISDLRFKIDKKSESNCDNDKSKGKIQIKNLKFSTVFEETVKKAEEEARRRKEKTEEGEYTDSSSSSSREEPHNSHFPKSSDPGGILKKQAAEIKITEDDRSYSRRSKESSYKSSKRERDRSRSHRRSRSRSTSRHRHRSSSRRRSRSPHSSRSRHRSPGRRSRSRERERHRVRHVSPRHSPRHRGRRSRSPTGVRLADSEKKRLLEVARRNAINMLKNGAVPAGAAALPPHTRSQVMAAIQSGGKSVDELTDFCKHLSKKEALGELSSVASSDEDMSENEDTLAFHHPFLVKEKAPIVMNIRGGAPLPVKSSILPVANKDELRLQFPVSSGSQHREKASEWVPVSPKKDGEKKGFKVISNAKGQNIVVDKIPIKTKTQLAKLNSKPAKSTAAVTTPAPAEKAGPLALPAPPVVPTNPPVTTIANQPPYMKSFTAGSQLSTTAAPGLPATPLAAQPLPAPPLVAPPLALPAPGPQAYPPGIEQPKIDISAIVSEKLLMIRKSQEQNELTSTRGEDTETNSQGDVISIVDDGLEEDLKRICGEDSKDILEENPEHILDENIKLDDDPKSVSEDELKSVLEDDPISVLEYDQKSVSEDDQKSVSEDDLKSLLEDDPKPIFEGDTKSVLKDDPKPVSEDDLKSGLEDDPKPVSEDDPKSGLEDDPKPVFEDDPKSVLEDDPKPVFEDDLKSVLDDDPKAVFEDEPKSVLEDDPKPDLKGALKYVSEDDPKSILEDGAKSVLENDPKPISEDDSNPLLDDDTIFFLEHDPKSLSAKDSAGDEVVDENPKDILNEDPKPILDHSPIDQVEFTENNICSDSNNISQKKIGYNIEEKNKHVLVNNILDDTKVHLQEEPKGVIVAKTLLEEAESLLQDVSKSTLLKDTAESTLKEEPKSIIVAKNLLDEANLLLQEEPKIHGLAKNILEEAEILLKSGPRSTRSKKKKAVVEDETENPDRKVRPFTLWETLDQLQRAAPVEGGMGMHLLQKMGWTPGSGLGKEGTGALQPLLLEVKLDTRGLQAREEVQGRHGKGVSKTPTNQQIKQRGNQNRRGGGGGGGTGGPAPLVAGGKHPVSLLGEYCSKHKLGPPEYDLCFECGPDHKKNFLFKVKVAGTEYQPAVASANKKQAKADAAQLALQKLGIVT